MKITQRPFTPRTRTRWLAPLAALCSLAIGSVSAEAGAVRPGFNTTTLPANDDGSTGRVTVGFWLNFFGAQYSQLYVNNNGNLTFDGPLSTYTPAPIAASGLKIIAPFWADVDTRASGSGVVRYSFGTGAVDGRNAFGANYVNVGYYNTKANKLNSFQVVLIDRSDVGPGDFDIEYNYDKVQWETGDASGGSGGVGGRTARVGYASGTGATLELGGSGVSGAFLDSNVTTGLIYNSLNSTVPGRYVFEVRNGGVVNAPPVANAGPDIIAAPGTTITLSGADSYDPESSPLTYFWTQEAGTAVTINNSATATPSFAGPNGIYTFKLTVSDGVLSSADYVNVNIGFPVASTRPATGITHNSAVLHASINPAGVATNYHFEYGPTNGTLISTPTLTLPATLGEATIDKTISGLNPTSSYAFRIVAENTNGASTGNFESFVTATSPVIPPTVSITSPASGASFVFGTIVNIAANAADTDGSVTKVEFFDGPVKIGEDTTAPYTQTVNGLAIGEHQLTAVATDNVGATSQSGVVAIQINEIPNLNAPVAANDGPISLPVSHFNVIANDSDADGDTLTVTSVGIAANGTATLEADGTVSYTPGASFTASDSFTYTITDGHNHTATATVTVRDTTAPVIIYNPMLVSASTGNNPTAPLPDVAALIQATDNIGVTSKTQSPVAGTPKGPGNYEVSVTVRDAAGNATTDFVLVTINDNSAPVITFTPGPQTVLTGNSSTALIPDVASLVSATDNIAVVSKTQAPSAGTALPPGIYTVIVTASDADGHSAQTTVQVTIADDSFPVVTTTPPSQTVYTGDNSSAPIPDVASLVTATDNVGVVSIVQSPIAGSLVGPGVYSVVVSVSDAAGNTTPVPVSVSVVDNVAPVFTKIPAARTIRALTDQTSVEIPNLAAESLASDNVAVTSITQSPEAGTVVQPGTYTVVLTAHDAAGNTSSAEVEVITQRGNRTPVAAYDSAFAMSMTLFLDVLANDSDPDGDAITIVSFTQPQHGLVTRLGNKLVFNPDLSIGESGESFTYTITDGEATATATVEITPIPNLRRFSGVIEDEGGPAGTIVIAFTKPGFFTGYINKDGIRHVFTGGMSRQGFGIGNVKLSATTLGGVTVRPGGHTTEGELKLLLGFTGVSALPPTEYFVEQSPFWQSVSTPDVGQFSVALTNPTGATTAPHASGFAIVKLAKNGATLHVGRAPNGQPFTSSGQLLSRGRIGFHGALGAPSVRRGYVAGTLVLDQTGDFIEGGLRWKLPAGRDVRFATGLDTPLTPIGDRYTRATTPQGVFGSTVAVTKTLEFSEGVFGAPVSASVTFGTTVESSVFDAPITRIVTIPSNGKISGHARPSGPTGPRLYFDGIILPIRGQIYGSLRGTTSISAIQGQ